MDVGIEGKMSINIEHMIEAVMGGGRKEARKVETKRRLRQSEYD